MEDSREVNVLLFKDNGRDMAVVLIEQYQTRLLIDGDAPKARAVEVAEYVLWPALEVPEADLRGDLPGADLYMEDIFCNSPLIKEVETSYLGQLTFGARRVFENDRWSWNHELQIRYSMPPPNACGWPLPSFDLSDNARDVVREYVKGFSGRRSTRFGPDLAVTEPLPILTQDERPVR